MNTINDSRLVTNNDFRLVALKFKNLGYTAKRAEELADMFFTFTSGYTYDVTDFKFDLN